DRSKGRDARGFVPVGAGETWPSRRSRRGIERGCAASKRRRTRGRDRVASRPEEVVMRPSRVARALAVVACAGLSAAFLGAVPAPAADAPRPGGPAPAASSDVVEIPLRDGIAVQDVLRIASTASDIPIVWSAEDKVITGRKLNGPSWIRVPKAK